MRVLANELGMSYMAGQWYSWGHWLSVLANGYELNGWLVVFLRTLATCARKWV